MAIGSPVNEEIPEEEEDEAVDGDDDGFTPCTTVKWSISILSDTKVFEQRSHENLQHEASQRLVINALASHEQQSARTHLDLAGRTPVTNTC